MAPVLGVVDVSDFSPVDLQMALAPGRDIHLEFVVPDGRDPLLKGGTLSNGKVLIGLPIRFSCGHLPRLLQRHFRDIFRNHEFGFGCFGHLGGGHSRRGFDQRCAAIGEFDHRQLRYDDIHLTG